MGNVGQRAMTPSLIGLLSPTNAVTLLAQQIPEFAGAETENELVYIQRVDQVAQIHRATDEVTLLASSKLVKVAKKNGTRCNPDSCWNRELVYEVRCLSERYLSLSV